MTLIKKITIEEYNEAGKVIKKTVTEEFSTDYVLPQPPVRPWWDQPLITHGAKPHDTVINFTGNASGEGVRKLNNTPASSIL